MELYYNNYGNVHNFFKKDVISKKMNGNTSYFTLFRFVHVFSMFFHLNF